MSESAMCTYFGRLVDVEERVGESVSTEDARDHVRILEALFSKHASNSR